MAQGPVIELESESRKLSVHEVMRKNFFIYILWVFGTSNALVWVLIVGMVVAEHNLLIGKSIAPGDRIINSNVVMTLLGATTVQLGAALIAITNFLFKAERQS